MKNMIISIRISSMNMKDIEDCYIMMISTAVRLVLILKNLIGIIWIGLESAICLLEIINR